MCRTHGKLILRYLSSYNFWNAKLYLNDTMQMWVDAEDSLDIL